MATGIPRHIDMFSPLPLLKSNLFRGAVLLTLLAVLLVFLRSQTAKQPEPPTTVSAIHPLKRDLVQTIDVTGEMKPFQQVEVQSLVAGYVQTINVDIGDHLKKGDLIATIEVLDIEKQMAAIRAAKKGIETTLSTNRAANATTTTIRAPFDGVVTKRNADNGALIQTGVYSSTQSMPLVTIAQDDLLRGSFAVPESAIGKLKQGQEISIAIPTLRRVSKGKISRFSNLVDSATRTMEVQVDIPNPDLSITPGLYAIASFPVEQAPGALSIPVQALHTPDEPSVYVVSADGTLESRPVKLGVETPEYVQITEGLGENDLVVLGNTSELEPGMKVSPKITESPSQRTGATGTQPQP